MKPYDLLDVSGRDTLGEGCWWSVEQQRLYWVDILGHLVRSAEIDGSGYREWTVPTEVGFVVPAASGQLVVGLRDKLALLDPGSGAITPGAVVEPRADHRLNDGKTDRVGRLWFGTMHEPETEASACFYRLDARGLMPVISGVTTSNGLGWCPDDTTMYHTDSPTGRICAYDFDAAAGTIDNPRVFASLPDGSGWPDGMTVDADGCVWGAVWQGSRVVCYAPDGRVLRQLRFPVERVTDCAFAGPDLSTLVVTSARGPRDDEPLAGRVFLLDVGAHGIAEAPVRDDITSPLPPHRPR